MTEHEGPPLYPGQTRQFVAMAMELAREGRTEMLADLVDHALPVDVLEHAEASGGLAEPQQSTGAGTRFVINMIGVVGLVFGVLPILRYLLQLDFFEFTTAPYDSAPARGCRTLPAARDRPRRCALWRPTCWRSGSNAPECSSCSCCSAAPAAPNRRQWMTVQ